MKQLLLALALTALTSLATAAVEPHYANIMAPVPGHEDVRYFDLMRQVVPDLAADGEIAAGHLPQGIGHLEGNEAIGELPETVTIRCVEVVPVRAGGRSMLWLLTDLGVGGNLGTYTLLAVFDDAAVPKLLDALEVDTYRFNGLGGAPFAISDDDEAMLIGSEHHNSSQSYQSRMLAFLHEGKLQLIASIFTFGMRSCDLWQTEELNVVAEPNHTDHWSIDATITRNRALAGQDCEDPAPGDWRHREFIASYVWDPVEQRYAVARNDFEELHREDEALF